jgi:hypothetical protein
MHKTGTKKENTVVIFRNKTDLLETQKRKKKAEGNINLR